MSPRRKGSDEKLKRAIIVHQHMGDPVRTASRMVDKVQERVNRQKAALDRIMVILRRAQDDCTCGAVVRVIGEGTNAIQEELSASSEVPAPGGTAEVPGDPED